MGFTWGYYEQTLLKILAQSQIICVAWKWLDEPTTHVRALSDYKGYRAGKLDDRLLVAQIWKLLDEADVVTAHNGDKFDIPKMNSRFVFHEMKPPSFYKTVDTRKVAYKNFRFDANSLNELAQYFGFGKKEDTGGFKLWTDCMAGDLRAWAKMRKYNRQDVVLLEKIYLRLRPYMSDHPNLNVIAGKTGLSCHICESESVIRRGFAITRAGRKARYQCNGCGTWSSGPCVSAKITLR